MEEKGKGRKRSETEMSEELRRVENIQSQKSGN